MSIIDMLNRGVKELHHWSRSDSRHLGEGGFDTATSSHSSELVEELCDRRRGPLEFKVGDHVLLKVMPKRGVVRFGKRGKLFSRYIVPFEILKRVGTVSYRLALPPSLLGVHEAFHVSMLRNYTPDLAYEVDWGELFIDIDGTFEEGPVRMVDSRDQVL